VWFILAVCGGACFLWCLGGIERNLERIADVLEAQAPKRLPQRTPEETARLREEIEASS
jgi:hypothetical protein